jgi:hypothetical protein
MALAVVAARLWRFGLVLIRVRCGMRGSAITYALRLTTSC